MIGLDQILKKCSEGITTGCTIAWHHVGYIIHYKENIQKLQEETKKLENELTRIDGRVQRAKNDGEIPEDDVLQWIKLANGIKVDVEALQDGARENNWCFKWCPNVYRRYKLGKDSEEKIAPVISIKEEGEKYMTLEVAHRAPPLKFGYNFSQGYEAFDSRAEILENIMKALADPCIKMIGLCGPGGVGKTTMATEVGKLAKQNGLFDDVAMATISQTLNEKAVKERLAFELDLKLDGSAHQLYHRLNNGKKNLVILDDVWENFNLADIEIPITDGNKGCKVVITSRIQGLCRGMPMPVDPEEFLIGVLREPEAWTLFKKVAAISVDSEIPSEAMEVCDKCGGLPVAICAVAAALKGKAEHAWRDALLQLKNYRIKQIAHIDKKLLISLNWSYDRLEPEDARSCFLLCSLFPEDAEISIDELVRYSMGMRLLDQIYSSFDQVRDRVLEMVDVLKTSCLLLDGRDKSVVKMHDIIRDVAISIAENEKRYLVKHGIEKWPEKGRDEHYSAISLRFTGKIHKFPNELERRGLHTLVLQCSNDSPTDFPNNFFNGMENNLEVLDLSEMPIKRLPSSLRTLVKLRMLCLNGGRLTTEIALLGILGSLRNLEILSLTCMKKVMFHDEDRTGFSELQFLKSQPQIPPGSFCNLCELRVEKCEFKFLFTHSIARGLEQLQRLEIGDCEDMEEIIRNERQGDEEEIIFHHLKKMVLKDLPDLRSFYSSMKNTSTTKANNSNPSRPLFCEKVAFPALEYLEIRYVDNISGIIGDKQLKLPVQQEKNESFWNLPRLQHLLVDECSELKAIVVANKEGGAHDKPLIFRELRSMHLTSLPNLKSFYSICGSKAEEEISKPQLFFNEKVAFPALEHLEIAGVGNISGIIGDKQLKLPVQQEENESFWNLPRLRDLRIGRCIELKAIVVANKEGGAHDKPLIFRELCSLHLLYLENLKSFYSICGSKTEEEISKPQLLFNEKVTFPALEDLSVHSIENISGIIGDKQLKLPLQQEENESFWNLPHLRDLHVSSCSKLKAIVVANKEGGAHDKPLIFRELRSLNFGSLKNLKSFYSICESKAEEEISKPQPLFNEKIMFPCLKELRIWNMDNFEIWISTPPTNSFNKLTRLYVDGCDKLLYVAPSELLGSLQNLQSLEIECCESIEEVFKTRGLIAGEGIVSRDEATSEQVEIIPVLPQLERVSLEKLPRLISFCFGYKLLSSVQLSIEECPSFGPLM
ncbi:Disease resistance protein RPS2 [Camellia lanceoleosa]|uniref:Disease resistance protein RPS2 n=1 Tax=Camellia lanceoleosa TaxID=1840588 RepID=A0ACC0H9J7_9ERIC|nr:Disease resistance protein RPS2 [Camellia lanceoleosa]